MDSHHEDRVRADATVGTNAPATDPAPAPAAPARRPSSKGVGLALALAAVLTAIGVPMAWLTKNSAAVSGLGAASNGMSTDGSGFGPGHIVLILAVVLLLLGLLRAIGRGGRVLGLAALVVSVLTLGMLALYFAINVLGEQGISAGVGLVLSAVGAVLALLFSLWAIIRH